MQSRVGKRLGQTARRGELPSVGSVLVLPRRPSLQFRPTAATWTKWLCSNDLREEGMLVWCLESNGDASIYSFVVRPQVVGELVDGEGVAGAPRHG